MLHPQLQQQLAALGLDTTTPPDPQIWSRLLAEISSNYSEHDATEASLADNELFFETMYKTSYHQALQLTLLYKLRTALDSKLDLNEVIRTAVEETADMLGYGLASLYLIENDELILQHQVGYSEVEAIDRLPITRGVMGRVARTDKAAFIEDVNTDPDYIPAIKNLASEICVPLHNRGQVVGVLNIETYSGNTLTKDDFDLITAVGLDVELAIEQARLYTALRESNEKYQLVVNNVREVIFRCDFDGYLTFLNNVWERLTGHTVEDSLGKHISSFLPPDELEKSIVFGRQLIERQQIDVRYRTMVNRPVGLPIPVEIHMQAVHDEVGREMFFAGTLADITEKLEQEKQATELVLKARTVEALKGFLNGVSHDLRTPLSTVITTCYLLRRRLEGNTALLGYINRLEEQVNILIRSVEDMLEMSHLDEDMVEFAFIKVNVNTLIRDVMVGLKTVAYGHHQNLNFEPFSQPLFVMADQLMLGKVVRNLVQNALYYTPSGGTITVQTTQSEGWITITVKDTGIGIASADLSQIFDRFYKADKARTGGTTGTGLGLPIVKKIVEIHNGIVEVSSEVGRGSSFKVRLPMVEDGSKKSESDTPPATPDVAISAL